MFEEFVEWLIWLSSSVPEVWVPRESPMFGVARAFWAMFLLLGLMYLVSVILRRPLFSRSLESKKRNASLLERSAGKEEKEP
jgi:hypothetical protein